MDERKRKFYGYCLHYWLVPQASTHTSISQECSTLVMTTAQQIPQGQLVFRQLLNDCFWVMISFFAFKVFRQLFNDLFLFLPLVFIDVESHKHFFFFFKEKHYLLFSSSIYFLTYSYSKFQRYTDTLGSDLYFRTLRPLFGPQFTVVMIQPRSLPTNSLKAQFKMTKVQYNMETKYVRQDPGCEVGQDRQGWSSLNQREMFLKRATYLGLNFKDWLNTTGRRVCK